jgi:hypothetical protein
VERSRKRIKIDNWIIHLFLNSEEDTWYSHFHEGHNVKKRPRSDWFYPVDCCLNCIHCNKKVPENVRFIAKLLRL